ncbi:MAG: DUF1963 domain-containing protein [Cyanobacteria bacterium SZAS-4]|nr:DUF1963 domain-containing protein [Cyanobacteria bacterium SZAS-4]
MTRPAIAIPLDKQSRPMKQLVEIDFHEVWAPNSQLPERGVLAVFVSQDIDKCQAKDKNCFQVVWLVDSSQTPNVVTNATTQNKVHADGSIETGVEGCSLLGNEHPKLNEAKAVCAFSANGITYNEARARDDCYSHLVSQAPNWRLLLRLLKNSTDYLLLIHEDDFAETRLERAWLVRLKRE